MTPQSIAAITDEVIAGAPITRKQAEWLVDLDEAGLDDLFRGATRIREHFLGRQVRCCSIVSAKTGRCSEDCTFCSQSAHFKTHVQGLTVLEPDQVVRAAVEAAANGAGSFGIVNSGYGPSDAEVEHWGCTIRRIRELGTLRACASMGVVTARQAERLAHFGVQRYNHNLQTSRRHFPNIIRTHSYDDRLQTLRNLKAAGISLCSGALFGMGETWQDRLDLAFELRDLDVEVVPLNFLIPIEGTPLEKSDSLPPIECLKIIAVYRFCLPRQQIKIAGGRERNLGSHQDQIFKAGADGFLIGNYLTTCGRPADADHRMIRRLGLTLVNRGPSGGPQAPLSGHEPMPAQESGHVRLPVLPATGSA